METPALSGDRAPWALAGLSDPEFADDHPRVEVFVEKFQTRSRNSLQRALDRSGKYLPTMAAILKQEGVPPELAYLPLIESGFRTTAVSPAGAVGPWQFIRSTGRRYGLRIDRYVDERRDPVKSTRAAAQYLRDLYGIFGSWHLSLAAYNTGEDRVARIRDEQGTDSFWEMMESGRLYRETRNFVPLYLAALRIAREPDAHGFSQPRAKPLRYESVNVKRSLPLRSLAQRAGVSAKEIKELNPALVRGVTPPGPQGYKVQVPLGTKEKFRAVYAQMLNEARDAQARPVTASAADSYRIRRGDSPASIARRFGVSVKALMRANGWKNPRTIRPGRYARIPGRAARKVAVASSGSRRTAPASRKSSARSTVSAPKVSGGMYLIRRGDTPSTIARRFGISTKALTRANSWRSARSIRVGATAHIPSPQRNYGALAAETRATAYRVQKGDSPTDIARRLGVSLDELMAANGWTDPRRVRVGARVHVPEAQGDGDGDAQVVASGRTYRVRRGDTPAAIARRFGVAVKALMKLNGWTDPRRIKPGTEIRIPAAPKLRVASRQPA